MKIRKGFKKEMKREMSGSRERERPGKPDRARQIEAKAEDLVGHWFPHRACEVQYFAIFSEKSSFNFAKILSISLLLNINI